MVSVQNVIEQPEQRGFELWQDTDDEIAGRAYLSLATSGYRSLRNLQVFCNNGCVTLEGQVPTYYLKQLAQTLVQCVEGVRDIDNDICVQRQVSTN
jgi:osmotically-inducible protein OsmY